MIKVLTAEQMREVDRLTTERYHIPSILLMENAAHAVAEVILDRFGGDAADKKVIVLCGRGNNGGDGAALARALHSEGAQVSAYLFGGASDTTGDARTNFDIAKHLGLLREGGEELLSEVEDNLESCDLVVDALFGTGLTRELTGVYVEVLGLLDGTPAEIVSVDLPSGLDADRAYSIGPHVQADVTVTFTAPKLASVLSPVSEANGEVVIANIGSPEELIDEQPSALYLAEAADVSEWLRRSEFTNASYKNKRGHLLIIAGSRNYTGAAVLCGDAAIRSGVGLVTIATPESSVDSVVARVSPEVMVRGISQTEEGSAATKAADEINEFLKNVDVIAVGSGLSSKEAETKLFVKTLIELRTKPIVIDADGLTALSPWSTQGDDVNPLILTPHEGEFRKLLGIEKGDADELLKDRVAAVRDFAARHRVIVLLKGERNLIAAPDGRVVVNPTGNSGLGKAGNGDTLTGILAGFVTQAAALKIDVFETVVAASYVAGMAGDLAEEKFGKRVMTASDVRECLVEVFAQFEEAA